MEIPPLLRQFQEYLAIERRYSPATVRAYTTDLLQLAAHLQVTSDINLWERKHLAAQPPDYAQLRGWLASLQIGPVSLARKVSTLKTFFRYLVQQGILPTNPAADLQKPKLPRRLPAWAVENDLQKLLDSLQWADDFTGTRDRLLLELLYGCGLRRAEVIGLAVYQLDTAQRTLKVLGKGRKERFVPFGKPVLEALAAYRQHFQAQGLLWQGPLLRTEKGQPLYPSLVGRVVKSYLIQLPGLAKTSPHVLRHSYATHLIDNGANLQAVKELLGHNSLAATQVYVHNSVQRLKDAHKKAHPKAEKS